MSATSLPDNDDMPAEIDFSGGIRGKFYRPDVRISLPTKRTAVRTRKRPVEKGSHDPESR